MLTASMAVKVLEVPEGPGVRGQEPVGFVSEVPEHLSLEMCPRFQGLHMLGLQGSQSGLCSSLISKELPKFGGTRKEELRRPTEREAIANICLLGSSTQKLKEVVTNSTQALQRTQSTLKTPRS